MRCVTCHDPHEVTSNDWKDYYTKPAIRQTCQDCHKTQADVVANTNTHKKMDCVDCHMPFTMSCETSRPSSVLTWLVSTPFVVLTSSRSKLILKRR